MEKTVTTKEKVTKLSQTPEAKMLREMKRQRRRFSSKYLFNTRTYRKVPTIKNMQELGF